MYHVSELRPQNKETAVAILIAVAVLVAVFCAGYMLGLRNAGKTAGGDVPNNGTGIEPVRNELSNAAEYQRQIDSGLESAVGRSNAAEERAGRIEERAGAAAQSVTDAGRILDECQQIVGRVRNRGKTGAVKD